MVAVGGGHGLAASIRAARAYAGDLVAIVSVADDGGSSGRLRETLGVLPPGDLRKCLVAMGDSSSVWSEAFEYRFAGGELGGHALGNLMIAGLAEVTGDYLAALQHAGRLLDSAGRVLPATTVPVVLKAEGADGEVRGQVAVAASSRIKRVSLVPPEAPTTGAALEALARADQVVIGPGSLYTSVLAAAIVPELRGALQSTRAQKVYVCNLAAQVPETSGYTVADHLEALQVDVVVCDTSRMPLGAPDRRWLDAALSSSGGGAHDPELLAPVLEGLLG